jgi:hypothetical protein
MQLAPVTAKYGLSLIEARPELRYQFKRPGYGNETTPNEVRYSAPVCIGARKTVVTGNPDTALVSISYAERSNLSLRMGNRRFTRHYECVLKEAGESPHACALYFMHYNFCRIHQTLRVTPAMEAGITDRVWSLEGIAAVIG